MSLIKDLVKQGKSLQYIAAILYDYKGVRSPNTQNSLGRGDQLNTFAGLMRLALYGPLKKKAKWQVWTPEMQEQEFRRERS